MESNHPRNVTPRNSVLKTGTATGPYPSPQACFYTAFCTLGRGAEIGVLWAQGAPGGSRSSYGRLEIFVEDINLAVYERHRRSLPRRLCAE